MVHHDGENCGPEERTGLASDRTMLANERTLAAWFRTATALVAAAVAFAKLFAGVHAEWLVKLGASLLIGLALVLLAIALRRYRQTARRLETYRVEAPSKLVLSAAAVLLGVAAILAGAALWLF